ncbi:hypothetical protein SUGI_0671350 [Cryptomeria japonica]|nr:hypothetical protein SUGI_0671350 [Cryptomeria japonica]
MGGAGKTTLAKELFNRKRSDYMATCFLFDVRETSSRFGFPSLQVKLLKDLLNENPPEFESIEEGSNYIRDRLGRSMLLSFLIVVDDIDHVKQLDALCLMDMANNSHNSLVVVTTRDVGVLTSAGITNRYNLKGLNRDDGRELFCWHSFGQPNPASGYENLVDDFIDVCGGLPLSLQVLGRHVYDRPVYYWELQLCKVRESLHPDIKDILKISFDALNRVEKQIFMDIACFFVDNCKNIAIRVWEGSGWGSRYALETLKDRCLVEEGEGLDGQLWEEKPVVLKMHDHLRDMGREMSNELTSPPRHWSPEYHISLERKGFQNILSQTKGRCFHSIYDRSVGSQITYFMGESEERGETSSSLLWLQLDLNCRELSSIPPWIPLQNLQCLRISHGYLKRLWQSNVQVPSQLKELQIYQTTLEEFPDFLGISDNLEQVVLDAKNMPIKSWSLLESLRVYPRSLVLACSTLHGELACNNRGRRTTFKSSYFTSLVIWDFVKLSDELDLYNIGESTHLKCPLSNLEYLEINNQIYVTKILICRNYCPKLLSLKIHDMLYLIEMNLLSVQTLNCLEINTCMKLKRLSETSNFRNLVEFNISQCPELEELGVVHLTCLEKLTIKNSVKLKILSGLSNLRKLVKLDIIGCPELEELPCSGGLTCLIYICIFRCGKLQKIHLEDCEKLEDIGINYCEKLQNITLPAPLFSFSLHDCKELQRVVAMGDLTKLRGMNISECPELVELPSLSRMCSLQEIEICYCGKLEFECLRLSGMKFLERITLDRNVKVKYFELDSCQNLETVMFGCQELMQLQIRSCPKLKELPSLSRMRRMQEIEIESCGKLQFDSLCLSGMKYLERITLDRNVKVKYFELDRCLNLETIMFGCEELIELRIRGCPRLEEIPSPSRMRLLHQIEIESCGKLHFESLCLSGMKFLERITLDKDVKVKYFELDSCQNLETIMFGCQELIEVSVRGCPKLEELPVFIGSVCLESVVIDGCGKLKNITLPSAVIKLYVKGCRELQSVAGISDLKKLTLMNVIECPELEELPSLDRMFCLREIEIYSCGKVEFEFLCLSGMKCLERIKLDRNVKVKYFELDSCQNLETIMFGCEEIIQLSIRSCPKLEELPVIRGSVFLERVIIDGCGKFKCLELDGCQRLRSVSGNLELTKLCINQCPELEELPSLSRMLCLENIYIESCEKMKKITLPSALISLYVKGCRELQRLAGITDLKNLTSMNIIECPQLEEVPNLDRMSCLQDIKIESCGKLEFEFLCLSGMQFLERITLDINVRVKYVELDSCQNLETIMFGCEKLIELRIRGCPKLEKLPAFRGAVCLESVIIDGCGKFRGLELDGCQNLRSVSGNFELTKLYINQCPKLEELASLASMRFLEEIDIKYCIKMKNITLPTTLISLSIWNCRDLQRISVIGDIMEITKKFTIWNCAMLEELPMLGTRSCTEEITICVCEKLKNITLPTKLISLSIWNCRDLQRISVTGDVMEITKKLFIRDCSMLEELPMFPTRNCMGKILMDGCDKLDNITGITELLGLGWMAFFYCSSALILNCIHKLKNVPSVIDMVGRAVDEVESSLNEDLFYDANIGVDGVIEITTHKTYPKWSELSAAIIFCFVVIIDTSTSVRIGEWFRVREKKWFKVREGKWIMTMVAFDGRNYDLVQDMKDAVLEYGIMKKGFQVEVKKGEVWKSVGALRIIIDRLHHS